MAGALLRTPMSNLIHSVPLHAPSTAQDTLARNGAKATGALFKFWYVPCSPKQEKGM